MIKIRLGNVISAQHLIKEQGTNQSFLTLISVAKPELQKCAVPSVWLMMFVSWLFIMGFSCSLLDLSSQYLLCKWSCLLLEYRIYTSPSCLSHFYLLVCPLISRLSLPSAAKKHLANEGLNCTFAKCFIFGKLVFSDNSEYPRSSRLDNLAGAGKMLEVQGCRKPGPGTLWSGFLLIFNGLSHPRKHVSEGRS